MHAIVHERLGLAGEVLEWRVVPEPEPPGEGEVLVRITFAPIHPGDLLAIEGSPAFGDLVSLSNGARIPGFEGVGIVEALGSAVVTGSQVNVGDRVAFFPVNGAWSERVVAPMTSLVRLPDEVTDEQACSHAHQHHHGAVGFERWTQRLVARAQDQRHRHPDGRQFGSGAVVDRAAGRQWRGHYPARS